MSAINKEKKTDVSIDKIHFDDAEDLAETMMSAMYEDPSWAGLWSPDMTLDNIIQDTAARLPWGLVKAGSAIPISKRFQKAVDESSGKAVGYARWILPDSVLTESGEVCWPAALPPQASDSAHDGFQKQFEAVTSADGKVRNLLHEREDDLSAEIIEIEDRIKKDNPNVLELDYLAVHPAFQRRGIGRLLLADGLALADQLGVKTFVLARAAGVKLYLNNGFREAEKLVQLRPEYGWDTPHVTMFLIREPALRA
ncbi:unnamed protein product [Zymoseptoria tritici ST99CH_1A5]|uniref:N-acetyltransferase domain-containing protein n=2 Tax=Zymoseptoria tritici TaxID=1047171 RepID=A0A1X7RJP3_ZYMT9|nr:unnamed protein product [Zymoseptoria tritici ST99CH_3D7]SMR47413.1 unnamed protein product [Zymoseptoria tritici ST99CH_3D1]SMY21312.1 unnamed protein product [Zymoseptoria tritici ST99CH_1A5]